MKASLKLYLMLVFSSLFIHLPRHEFSPFWTLFKSLLPGQHLEDSFYHLPFLFESVMCLLPLQLSPDCINYSFSDYISNLRNILGIIKAEVTAVFQVYSPFASRPPSSLLKELYQSRAPTYLCDPTSSSHFS